MSDTDLCYLSASEAIERFKQRTLSPVELMQALIARAEAVEPVVNAFADSYFDEALAKARRAEARYMKTDGRVRALEGVPLAVKDAAAIKGRVTTQGSLIYKDHVDDHTNPAIERLLRAGAILHARTTTPEFGIDWVTTSRLHGTTRSPWDPRYTCGGSSGGSAAALAAGTTTLATGADNAGSLRVPAACCGVIGYRAPHGRFPSDPPFNLEMYSAIGPMTRTVADCALMQNVMAGPHPLDNAAIRPKLRIPQRLDDIKGWRIAYSLDLGFREVAPEVKALTLAALDAARPGRRN
jgi:amidase